MSLLEDSRSFADLCTFKNLIDQCAATLAYRFVLLSKEINLINNRRKLEHFI